MKNQYDSTKDTLEHIRKVQCYLFDAVNELIKRAKLHDKSKLEEPEKSIFDELTPKLKKSTYGSDEYREFLAKMEPALKNHYAKNTHHPEHYSRGIDGMNLFDVLEMFCDWKAASERHDDGDIYKSIEINSKRFKMTEQLKNIFNNTAHYMKFEGKDARNAKLSDL